MNSTEKGELQPGDTAGVGGQILQVVVGIALSITLWWGLLWVIPTGLLGLHWSVTMLVLPLIIALLIAGIVYSARKQFKVAVVAFLAGFVVVEFVALIFNITMGA